MPYKKYDPKVDELREGMKIRLGGLEMTLRKGWSVTVGETDDGRCINIPWHWFPDLEIFIQPLTIPQRTKQAVLEKYLDPKINYETFRAFLESLEVTND